MQCLHDSAIVLFQRCSTSTHAVLAFSFISVVVWKALLFQGAVDGGIGMWREHKHGIDGWPTTQFTVHSLSSNSAHCSLVHSSSALVYFLASWTPGHAKSSSNENRWQHRFGKTTGCVACSIWWRPFAIRYEIALTECLVYAVLLTACNTAMHRAELWRDLWMNTTYVWTQRKM